MPLSHDPGEDLEVWQQVSGGRCSCTPQTSCWRGGQLRRCGLLPCRKFILRDAETNRRLPSAALTRNSRHIGLCLSRPHMRVAGAG